MPLLINICVWSKPFKTFFADNSLFYALCSFHVSSAPLSCKTRIISTLPLLVYYKTKSFFSDIKGLSFMH